jgi:hypothetical protein
VEQVVVLPATAEAVAPRGPILAQIQTNHHQRIHRRAGIRRLSTPEGGTTPPIVCERCFLDSAATGDSATSGPSPHLWILDGEAIGFGGYDSTESWNAGALLAAGYKGHVVGYEGEYSFKNGDIQYGRVGLGGYGDKKHGGWLVSTVGGNLTIAGFAGAGMAGVGGYATIGYNCN